MGVVNDLALHPQRLCPPADGAPLDAAVGGAPARLDRKENDMDAEERSLLETLRDHADDHGMLFAEVVRPLLQERDRLREELTQLRAADAARGSK